MPIRVEDPSWFSAIRADDKPVYLNREGVIKTGKSLKGRLVSIAESLGIFKGYVSGYRGREAARNRDAYDAVWRSITHKYGTNAKRYTQKVMKNRGYSHVDSYGPYVGRLRGRNIGDPQRAIVGRELRLILDTARARGVDQTLRKEADIAQQQEVGPTVRSNKEIAAVRSDKEIAAQKQRWAAWTGHRQSDAEVATPGGTEAMNTVATPDESPGNTDGIAENLRGLEMSVSGLAEVAETRDSEVTEASTPGSRIDETGSKADRVIRGLGRATKTATVRVETAGERVKVPHDAQRQPAAVANPSPTIPLPKPRKYRGVDYFDQSNKEIVRLSIPIRNHQGAKQVAVDKRYLATSVPEGRRGSELTAAHQAYIKTTLLRHVAEHERTRPSILLDAGDLHRMMRPITARALEMQSDRKLGAKVLYKNVAKHLGRKEAAFGDALKKLRRDARSKAGSKVGLLSFVQGAARKANIDIVIDPRVLRSIRPQVKDMAEVYVDEHRKALTTPDLEHIVQVVLSGYSLADRMGLVS